MHHLALRPGSSTVALPGLQRSDTDHLTTKPQGTGGGQRARPEGRTVLCQEGVPDTLPSSPEPAQGTERLRVPFFHRNTDGRQVSGRPVSRGWDSASQSHPGPVQNCSGGRLDSRTPWHLRTGHHTRPTYLTVEGHPKATHCWTTLCPPQVITGIHKSQI